MGKAFATSDAHKGPFPGMKSLMGGEVGLLAESFSAFGTFKRFLPCVDSLMSDKVTVILKPFAAEPTYESSFLGERFWTLYDAGVETHVVSEHARQRLYFGCIFDRCSLKKAVLGRGLWTGLDLWLGSQLGHGPIKLFNFHFVDSLVKSKIG